MIHQKLLGLVTTTVVAAAGAGCSTIPSGRTGVYRHAPLIAPARNCE